MAAARRQTAGAFKTAGGSFVLRCRPVAAGLRAWDAADEYLLDQAAAAGTGAVLVVNDTYGALVVGCDGRSRTSVLDSLAAQEAAVANLTANKQKDPVRFVRTTDSLDLWGGPYGLALLRIPSSRSYLEYLLERLRWVMQPDTLLLAAGMTKHLYPGLAETFERHFGSAKVDRVHKKALLLRARPQPHAGPLPPADSSYSLPDFGCTVSCLPNVFSSKGLDAGSRLLLETLSKVEVRGRVVDLGCGSGVLGLVAAKTAPEIDLVAVDDSHLAVEAARRTFKANGIQAQTRCADGLAGQRARSLDWVVANPPFHHRQVAARLFGQAARCLKEDGGLLLVCRDGLGYKGLLQRGFASVESLNTRGPYRVWLCRQPTVLNP